MSLFLLNLFVMIYIGKAEALEGRDFNRMDLTNETFYAFITYYKVTFTDFAQNLESKVLAGWLINIFLTSILIINIISILIEYLCLFIVHIKRLYNKYHHQFTKIKNKCSPCISLKFLEYF